MEVDELMRVLPKMVEPEFTAEMESALDDVAAGNNSGKVSDQLERDLLCTGAGCSISVFGNQLQA